MPREISVAEETALARYNALGTPDMIESTVRKLKKENAARREENATLKADLEKAPKVAEGGLVLTKEESADFDAYKALGKPADVKKAVETLPTVEAALKARDRETARDAAAKALGIEGKDLAPFNGSDALTYEVREQEVERNGQKEKVPVAFVKDAEGKEHQLDAYGKEKWGRSFEAMLETANGATTTANGSRYTVETGNPAPRGGKPTDADQRKATEGTASYTL